MSNSGLFFYSENSRTGNVWFSLPETNQLASGNQLVEKAFFSVSNRPSTETSEQWSGCKLKLIIHQTLRSYRWFVHRVNSRVPKRRAGTRTRPGRTDTTSAAFFATPAGWCVQELACCLRRKCAVQRSDLLSVTRRQVC